MASSHLPHGGKLSNLFKIGKKNTEPHRGGAFQEQEHGGGAYKRRLKHRKECELGRAAATFDILKNRDSRKGGRLGQVTLLSGARTTRLFHLRWSVNNDFPLVSDQIYFNVRSPKRFVPGLSPEARREAVKRFPSFRFFNEPTTKKQQYDTKSF